SVQHCYRDDPVLEPALGWASAKARVHVVGRLVISIDGHQLGFVPAAEDASAHVAHRSGQGPPAQRAVNVNRSSSDDLRPGCDRTQDSNIPMWENYRLPGT